MALGACVAASVALTAAAGGDTGSGLEADFGLAVSTGLRNTLDDVYPDASIYGGYCWFDVGLGYRWMANRLLSVTPGAAVLVNCVAGDETVVSSIVLPKVTVRCRLGRGSAAYIGAEANSGVPCTSSGDFDLEPAGLGFGGVGGFAVSRSSSFEAGYTVVPVDVRWDRGADEKDFGGFVLRAVVTF